MAVPRVYRIEIATGQAVKDTKSEQDQWAYFAIRDIVRSKVGVTLLSVTEVNTRYGTQKDRPDLVAEILEEIPEARPDADCSP